MANFTPQEIEQFLQEFFDVVGARQYVGARYVPIFGRAGEDTVEWDDLAPYEPLTVVMHEGVSYVSRRYVPKGIAITDTDYWVQTYRFNAQVEAYRQEVLSFQGQIDNRIPYPDPDFFPKFGELGQVLSTLADGTVKWEDPVVPSDEQAEEVITQWLDDHPEATTTVQDGAITTPKLANASVTTAKIVDSAITTAKINDGAVTDDKLSTSGIKSRVPRLFAPVGEGLQFFNMSTPLVEPGTIINEINISYNLTRCMSSLFIMNQEDYPYTITAESGYELRYFSVDPNMVVVGMGAWGTSLSVSNPTRYIVLIVRNADTTSTITPEEARAAIAISDNKKPMFSMLPMFMLQQVIAGQNSVDTTRIVDGAVTTAKIRDNSVTDAKLNNDGLKARVPRLFAPKGEGLQFFNLVTATVPTGTPINEIDISSSTTRCMASFFSMSQEDYPFTINAESGYELRVIATDDSMIVTAMTPWTTQYYLSVTNRFYSLVVRKADNSTITPNEAQAAIAFSDNKNPSFIMLPVFMLQHLIATNGAMIEDLRTEIEDISSNPVFDQFSLNMNQIGNFDETWEYNNWVYPMAVSQDLRRNRLFYGFTTSSGYAGVAQYDFDTQELTKTILKQNVNREIDDHDLVAVLNLSNFRIICAYAGGHNTDKTMCVRYSYTREGIELFSDAIVLPSAYFTTYAQLFEYNGRVYLFYRGSNNQWLYRVSAGIDESGLQTWGEERRFIYHNDQMYCTFRKTNTDGVLLLCTYTNPSANDTSIRCAYMHLDSMTLYETDNATVIGTEVALTDVPSLIPIPGDGKVNRLFEAAVTPIGNIKIAYCVFTNASESSDGVYKIYDNGTITDVVESGVATWVPKAQNGIGWIGTDRLIVGRGYSGRDLIEIYDYDVTDGVTLERVIANNERTKNGTSNNRTSKPIIDTNQRVCLFWEGYYNPSVFTNFYTSAKIYSLEDNEILV